MSSTVADSVELASARKMPALGLGTWQLTGDAADRAIRHALEIGYRMIDTSGDYGNQPRIAAALAETSLGREQVFLVSKVEEDEDPYTSARQKLDELETDYLDLCLLHRPPPSGAGEELWEGLLRARDHGLALEVGVSNYSPDQIDRLIEATGEQPAVNQIEWSPFGHSHEVMAHASQLGVVIQAYCPLTRAERLDDGTVVEIADAHQRSPAQILLRWSLEVGAVPVPKAESASHREQNISIFDFELSEEETARLTALNEHYSALGGLPYV